MNAFSMSASFDDAKTDQELEYTPSGNYVRGKLFLLFILILVLLMVRVIMNPGTFPIRTVRIEGEFRHLSPRVLKAGVTDVVRGGFFDVNVETIQKTLMKNPWVRRVSVQRVWPDGLRVQVTERVAVARWKNEGLLSSESVLFSPAVRTYPEGLPLFSGPDDSYRLLMARYYLINSLLQGSDVGVSALNLNDRGAFDFSLSNGVSVVVGRNRIDDRIERFARYALPVLRDEFVNITGVDMRYTNGFVVSWKEKSEKNVETGKENHG